METIHVNLAQRAYDVQIRVIWPYLEFVSLSVILLVTLAALYLRHGDLTAVAPQIALLGMALVLSALILLSTGGRRKPL